MASGKRLITVIKEKFRRYIENNLLWVLFLVIVLYFILGGLAVELLYLAVYRFPDVTPAMTYINYWYTPTIGTLVLLVIVGAVIRKNHFILRSFLPEGVGRDHKVIVAEDTYEASQNNTVRNLLIGLLLGFLTNFCCILCAVIHGDLRFYPDFSAAMIPTFLYAFLMVFIQSSSEELWCRGYMYERILIHYPLWAAVLANGIFFGLIHIFNDGATVFAIAEIAVCGISYSLVRWYTGSIWMVMGIHTMWNFTQSFLFGLPNSGLVSEVSILHLDAMNGVSNLFYNYEFGVEGGTPSIIMDALLGIICLILAKRDGRLSELCMSYEKKAALAEEKAAIAQENAAEGNEDDRNREEPAETMHGNKRAR